MPTMTEVNNAINWREFYSKFLELEGKGDELKAKCPFHSDKQASLGINIKTGLWVCYGCGEKGNGQTFLYKHRNMSAKEAREYLLQESGLTRSQPTQQQKRTGLTVVEYARSKKLPEQFLAGVGLRNGKGCIIIPYFDESGAEVSTRRRHAVTGAMKFTWARGSRVMLYGLNRLPEIRKAGYVVLVEGESDAHTLWHHNIPALGVPGATVFQRGWVQQLAGLKLVIHREPDAGGEAFVRRISECLVDARWSGEAVAFSIPGHKDPSELHLKDPESFLAAWEAAVGKAAPLDVRALAVRPEEVIPGAPVQLRIPSEWRVNIDGVFHMTEDGPVQVCPMPILISRRLKSVDTSEEKVELIFFRDGKWQSCISQRSIVFHASKLPMLADRGMSISSENAKNLVKYLGSLEAHNMATLQVSVSSERMGWIDSKRFLPGLADDVVLDLDSGSQTVAGGYHQFGTFDAWREFASEVRRHPVARFLMAAAFASPLLHLLDHRVFIVHVWGPSRGGKTAALKAAQSVWGHPETLIANFNTTKVGLERLAALYSDLPLCVDEKQVAADKYGMVGNLIYLLGLGKGRARGSKTGGLQQFKTWRTIVMTSGEEPLSDDTSQTGIKTRALELYGQPLPDEKLARQIHVQSIRNYGWAGPEFIRRLLAESENDSLHEDYAYISEQIEQFAPDKMGSHLTALAVVGLADCYASQWIFGTPEEQALDEMAEMIREITEMLESAEEADYSERVWEFVSGWLNSYSDKFTNECHPPQYGFKEDGKYCVVPDIIRQALKEAGFNPGRALRDLAEKGAIGSEVVGGVKRYTIRKWWNQNRARMVVIKPDIGF